MPEDHQCEVEPLAAHPLEATARETTAHAHLIQAWKKAYSSGTLPAFDQASPHQWAMSCHEMFEAGYTELLEFAARRLHAAYPDLEYLTTMVAWFDAVPRELPLLPFRDVPAAEVQTVRMAGCEAVLACFCAQAGTLGLPINFIHQWLGRLPVNLVYLKDFRDLSGLLGFPSLAVDRAGSLAALRDIAGTFGAQRIYTFGVSAGGYAAMHYGLDLDAVAVLNLAGATDLSPAFLHHLDHVPEIYRRAQKAVPDGEISLPERYTQAQRRPDVLIAFCAGAINERAQAERMAGLPNVELITVPDSAQHNVVDPLIRRGEFMRVLQRLLIAEKVER